MTTDDQVGHWYTLRARANRRSWRVRFSQAIRRWLHRTGLDL